MGGDNEAAFVVPGLDIALVRNPDMRLILFGDGELIERRLAQHARVRAASSVVHCAITVSMRDKPSEALRRGRRHSSMWRTIEAVKLGEADAAVSAGNTGALMAMAKFVLKTMAQIERPAIAAIWPTVRGESIVLDVGATIGADAQQLVDFAVMGAAMAQAVFGITRPRVGLLNIGVEEVKGLEEVRHAGQMLRASDLPGLEYHGFVEGADLGRGTVDVVVTEGFSGNIALKTAEGTAKQIAAYLRAAIARSIWARIGYVIASSAFRALREKMDPRRANGGVFLGLNGMVIKSHGGTDPQGFASAVDLAVDMARSNLVSRIAADIGSFHAGAMPTPVPIEPKAAAS
jgi:glycerol-3-phosphate acyltransferase PlsX